VLVRLIFHPLRPQDLMVVDGRTVRGGESVTVPERRGRQLLDLYPELKAEQVPAGPSKPVAPVVRERVAGSERALERPAGRAEARHAPPAADTGRQPQPRGERHQKD
jgi:hypothetical protein